MGFPIGRDILNLFSMKLKGKLIVLEKIQALKYKKGDHPNGVKVGDKFIGFVKEEPEEGVQLYLYPTLVFDEIGPSGWTSVVQEIDFDKMEIRTMNSVYKITVR